MHAFYTVFTWHLIWWNLVNFKLSWRVISLSCLPRRARGWDNLNSRGGNADWVFLFLKPLKWFFIPHLLVIWFSLVLKSILFLFISYRWGNSFLRSWVFSTIFNSLRSYDIIFISITNFNLNRNPISVNINNIVLFWVFLIDIWCSLIRFWLGFLMWVSPGVKTEVAFFIIVN